MRKMLLAVLAALMLFSGCRKAAKPEEKKDKTEVKSLTVVPEFVIRKTNSPYEKFVGDWIFASIDEAWDALADQRAGFAAKSVPLTKKGGRKRRGGFLDRADYMVILAVVKLPADDHKIHFIKVDSRGMPSEPGYTVKKGSARGVGTSYEVKAPPGHVVLAIKRALRLSNGYEEVIYSPYSPSLDFPLVRQRGYQYLVRQITAAQEDLKGKGVKSKAFEGSLVADEVPLRVALALSVIEHVDPTDFQSELNKFKGDEQKAMEVLANRVLTVVGCNREMSYAYAKSSAGAFNLFQFIPRTYSSLVKKYPSAKLVPGFVAGMEDHENAAKASLLLFDSDWSYVRPGHRLFLKNHADALGMYLAAAYNGGAGRAAKAVNTYAQTWTDHVLPETRIYIQKYRGLAKALGNW